MGIKIGCDIVSIRRFKSSTQRGGQKFLVNLFSPHELAHNKKNESLAGLFAAKEAVIKALGLKAGDWPKIEIVKDKNGRPGIRLANPPRNIISQDLSISHDKNYALACAVFLVQQDK